MTWGTLLECFAEMAVRRTISPEFTPSLRTGRSVTTVAGCGLRVARELVIRHDLPSQLVTRNSPPTASPFVSDDEHQRRRADLELGMTRDLGRFLDLFPVDQRAVRRPEVV